MIGCLRFTTSTSPIKRIKTIENIISHVHILYILRKLTTIQAKSQTNPQKNKTEFKTHFQEKIHYTDPLQISEDEKTAFFLVCSSLLA